MPAESAVRDGNRPGYQLIETLRWERSAGFLRGERHLARMSSSASALGFAWQQEAAEAALAKATDGSVENMLRLRLTLNADGTANCTSAPFQPLPANKVWRLKIANARLFSGDALLRHKTSRRDVYEAARAEYPADAADEVLLFNERGELCEGTITTLFLDMGGDLLLTPALDCGLLAGVFRQALIDDGKAREAVITSSEFQQAKAIYVGNSLRGLIPALLL